MIEKKRSAVGEAAQLCCNHAFPRATDFLKTILGNENHPSSEFLAHSNPYIDIQTLKNYPTQPNRPDTQSSCLLHSSLFNPAWRWRRLYLVRKTLHCVVTEIAVNYKVAFGWTFKHSLYGKCSEKTNIRLHNSINTVFVVHREAEEFPDLFDLQVLSGFSQQQSGRGDSCRAAKCLIKHSGVDFSPLCRDRSAALSNSSHTLRL